MGHEVAYGQKLLLTGEVEPTVGLGVADCRIVTNAWLDGFRKTAYGDIE